MDDNEVEKRAADVWILTYRTGAGAVSTSKACDHADEAADRFREKFHRHPTINQQRASYGLVDLDD